MWQLINNCLPNMSFLSKRKITSSDLCPLCLLKTETNQHLFLECEKFNHTRLKIPFLSSDLNTNFIDILHKYNNQPNVKNQIAIILWLVWKSRNNFIFANKPINNYWIWEHHKLYMNINNKENKRKLFILSGNLLQKDGTSLILMVQP